jgi:hypothetical protein
MKTASVRSRIGKPILYLLGIKAAFLNQLVGVTSISEEPIPERHKLKRHSYTKEGPMFSPS